MNDLGSGFLGDLPRNLVRQTLDETVQEDVVVLEHLEELGRNLFSVRVVQCDIFVFDDLEYRLVECGLEVMPVMSFVSYEFDKDLCEFAEIAVHVQLVFVECTSACCLWDFLDDGDTLLSCADDV